MSECGAGTSSLSLSSFGRWAENQMYLLQILRRLLLRCYLIDKEVTVLNCDFCNVELEESQATRLTARTFVSPVAYDVGGVLVGYIPVGDWAACGICAGLVLRQEWAALIERVLVMEGISQEMMPEMRKHYQLFYKRLT